MRKRIFEIIEIGKDGDTKSLIYDRAMMALIIASIVPLFFKQTNRLFVLADHVTVTAFVIDYALRWVTADYKLGRGAKSFLLYPFTFYAIVDLLSILPSFTPVNAGLKLLRLLRLVKAFKVLRMLRYSKSFSLILSIVKRERKPLAAVCWLAGGYVVISALIMFLVEPDSFESYFDAFYWAVVTLTTVGYGDIYPTSDIGRIVSMVSSFMGIAIVALPTGIITAGYQSAVSERPDETSEAAEDQEEK